MAGLKSFLLAGGLVLLLITALAVIASKYQTRSIFIEIKKQENLLNQYAVEWGRLQIELTTLSDQNRIERIARERLGLKLPRRDQIIYLKP